MTDMAKYPIYLEMTGRRAVIVGGGNVAARKAADLLACGARLVIVTPRASEAIQKLSLKAQAELIRARYAKEYLGGAVLAIAATDDHAQNRRIYEDCQELEIICHVVDDPDLCDFFVPSVVKRGDLQIAIGTDGYCPAYASHLRKKLERQFGEEHGLFLQALELIRLRLFTEIDTPTQRKALLGELVGDTSFDIFLREGEQAWQAWADERIQSVFHVQP